jgi:cobalt/nickel transport system ATP-binding protein
MAKPVIQIEDVAYGYPDGTIGIHDANLTVERGERVAIIGPNGAGKSTLLLLAGGLLSPTAGTVRFFGEFEDPEAVRSRIGVLMQDPDDFLFNPTVREDIKFGPTQLDTLQEDTEAIIANLAEALDLHGLLDKPPFRLSGGEKNRAALASVLSFKPEVLFLDEPVSNIDPTHTQAILDLLNTWNTEKNTTLITSTPDVELVPRIADRVCLIGTDKTPHRIGPVRDVLTDIECLEQNHLAAPSLVKLFSQADCDTIPIDLEEAIDILN